MNMVRQIIEWFKQLFRKKVKAKVLPEPTLLTPNPDLIPKAKADDKAKSRKGDLLRIGKRHGAKRRGYR